METTRKQKEILKKLHDLGFKSAQVVPNHCKDLITTKEKKLVLR